MLPAQQRLQRHDTVRFHVDDRLIVHVELPLCSAVRRLDSMAMRSLSLRSMPGLKSWKLLRPRSFAWYIAVSELPQQLTHVDAVVRIQRDADTPRSSPACGRPRPWAH